MKWVKTKEKEITGRKRRKRSTGGSGGRNRITFLTKTKTRVGKVREEIK